MIKLSTTIAVALIFSETKKKKMDNVKKSRVAWADFITKFKFSTL